jgi:hypothetical protein
MFRDFPNTTNSRLSISSLFRHAGPDPASRRRPDLPSPKRLRAGRRKSGTISKPDSGSAGMTILIEAAIYKQTLIPVFEFLDDFRYE